MEARALVDRHPLVSFTLVAYAFSWGAWTVQASVADTSVLRTALFVLGVLGPFAAGAGLTVVSGDRVRPWLGDIFTPRVPARYYVVSLAVPVLVVAVSAAAHRGLLAGEFTPALLPSAVEYPLFLGFVLLFGGGLEEPGWRGWLQPRLQTRRSPLAAALVVGVVWAVWHLPLFLLPGTPQSDIVPLLYLPQVVGLSVVLAWLSNAASGSVVPAMVLHAGANAIVNYYPVGGAAGALTPPGHALLVAVIVAVAVAVVALAGSRLSRTPAAT